MKYIQLEMSNVIGQFEHTMVQVCMHVCMCVYVCMYVCM